MVKNIGMKSKIKINNALFTILTIIYGSNFRIDILNHIGDKINKNYGSDI